MSTIYIDGPAAVHLRTLADAAKRIAAVLERAEQRELEDRRFEEERRAKGIERA